MPARTSSPVLTRTARAATQRQLGRTRVLAQYQGYIKKVAPGVTGRLTPGKGETPAAVRRRLGAAAKALGVELTVKRVGGRVFFWR